MQVSTVVATNISALARVVAAKTMEHMNLAFFIYPRPFVFSFIVPHIRAVDNTKIKGQKFHKLIAILILLCYYLYGQWISTKFRLNTP